MTDDLAAFVAARLDEDEAVATAANGNSWLVADFTEEDAQREGDLSPEGLTWVMNEYMHMFDTDTPTAAHIARHDPARVLREVAAKRRMLNDLDLTYPDEEFLLKLLAAVWSDHPDYRAEWKP